jgi:hypothetical protein
LFANTGLPPFSGAVRLTQWPAVTIRFCELAVTIVPEQLAFWPARVRKSFPWRR